MTSYSNKSDESVICIDSDSSDSVIYLKSSDPPPYKKSFNSNLNRSRTFQRPPKSYSSSEEESERKDLNGFEIVKRLYGAMESFAHIPDHERNKRFWNSNVVRDFKSYLYSVDQRLRHFVKDLMEPDMIILNNIPKKLWNFISDQAIFYGLHVQSRGSNQEEYLLCNRTSQTYIPQGWLTRLDSLIFETVNNIWRCFLGKKRTSIDLDPTSGIGYQMLIKMGWQPGTPLGIRGGILEPISLKAGRYSKSGLGVEDYF